MEIPLPWRPATNPRALIRRISCPDHWLRPALCPRHHSSGPRNLVWINVTPHPTAEWIARQVTEAFPWVEAPRYLIRDQDRVYGATVTHQLRARGIRDKPIVAERLIGSILRECVDHLIVLGEAHLRRILTKYASYYNELRTHRSLNKDAPIHRDIQHVGRIVSAPILGGLHHHYCPNLIFGTDRPILRALSS